MAETIHIPAEVVEAAAKKAHHEEHRGKILWETETEAMKEYWRGSAVITIAAALSAWVETGMAIKAEGCSWAGDQGGGFTAGSETRPVLILRTTEAT